MDGRDRMLVMRLAATMSPAAAGRRVNDAERSGRRVLRVF